MKLLATALQRVAVRLRTKRSPRSRSEASSERRPPKDCLAPPAVGSSFLRSRRERTGWNDVQEVRITHAPSGAVDAAASWSALSEGTAGDVPILLIHLTAAQGPSALAAIAEWHRTQRNQRNSSELFC